MDRNILLQLNQKYERHLSDFGKKVLHELVKQWDKAREQKSQNNNYRQCSQAKKILSFNDNTLNNTSRHSPPIQIYSTREAFQQVVAPEVPTSEDLTKTLQIDKGIDNNEFVHPTIFNSNIVQQLNKSPDKKYDDHLFNKVNSIFDHATDVGWNNMFDSELFDDGKNYTATEETNVNTEIETFNIELNRGNNEKVSGKRKNKNKDKPKTIKKPKTINSNPNELHKKTTFNKTKNDGPKPSFRKQKYTKTVKNWLNDVESLIPNNEEIHINILNNNNNDNENTILDTGNQEARRSTAVNDNKLKITVDKSVKGNKKVVQARLANKDGIMKFCKPKNKIDEFKKTEIETIVADSKLFKDKKDKVKNKFIPPIKSQIPVKNITYKIRTVDDKNADECFMELMQVKEEITAVLVFSNGFCQLNSQFTDGACAADGALLGAGDIILYCPNSASSKIKEALRLLVNEKIVISYEARTILMYLTTHLQMEINTTNMYDAKIGASLLDPDNPPENFNDLQKLLSFTPEYTIATECTLQKAAWYMSLLRECWARLHSMLVENQLWQVFVHVEMKLLPIIAEMERRGVLIDLSKLKSMEEVLVTRMKLVEQECYKAAGKVFQINSTVQVRGILYDELQLDTKCNVKIRETLSGGVKSTSETMLRSLMSVHPLPKLILEYRHLHKAHATFLAGIAHQAKDGIVKPTWEQTAAATGRIASNNPNLQAIPKTPFSLVMFPGADETDIQQLNFRSVYVSRAGCSFVAADFKHIECRVFAHAAADTGLLQALTHSDDLFRVLAAQWLNKCESGVTVAERERTKRLVYASLYGAGTRKLMEILDLTYEQALQVAASFNRTFPCLKSFGREVVSRCSAAGGRLSTLRGRVRHFANITSENFNLRSHAERQAVNFVVQGSAADLCKSAMILTQAALRASSVSSVPVRAHLVLQIHDELVWEVRDQHVHAAAGIIKHVMEGCGQQCGMSMLLPVAITVGKNWGEMNNYSPDTSTTNE